ncbi:hypothetical protein PCA20602_02714 [Pandoraea capi]|uniref:MarR family transcriptional regulator n=1 Tax=Pandoraea capi TaxID=2508286 RepID=A0ABY6W176_9BURK|nr:hypothetical protein [Pandoraea capi]VVE12607.1 hypothetical protein PCA20602_02714 [Pandoraea capi]
MKHDILESMDRGIWYCVETLTALAGHTNRETREACLLLVGEGLLDMDTINEKRRFRLAMTKGASRQPDYSCVPTTATAPYYPSWTPLRTYDQYVKSHQQLCEERR